MREKLAPVQICRSFGEFIRDRRIALNLTQSEVASSVGIGQGYLSKVEAGSREPTLTISLKLCDVLGLDINDFAKQII